MASRNTSSAVFGSSNRTRQTPHASTVATPDWSADVDAWIARAHAAGARVVQITPRHETLEDLFVRQVAGAGRPTAGAKQAKATS